MTFQVISAVSRSGGRAGSGPSEPGISYYGKSSQFRLNTAAIVALGNPTKLEVMYDAETNRVAFVPSDAAYAVTLRKDSEKAVPSILGFAPWPMRQIWPIMCGFHFPLFKTPNPGIT